MGQCAWLILGNDAGVHWVYSLLQGCFLGLGRGKGRANAGPPKGAHLLLCTRVTGSISESSKKAWKTVDLTSQRRRFMEVKLFVQGCTAREQQKQLG